MGLCPHVRFIAGPTGETPRASSEPHITEEQSAPFRRGHAARLSVRSANAGYAPAGRFIGGGGGSRTRVRGDIAAVLYVRSLGTRPTRRALGGGMNEQIAALQPDAPEPTARAPGRAGLRGLFQFVFGSCLVSPVAVGEYRHAVPLSLSPRRDRCTPKKTCRQPRPGTAPGDCDAALRGRAARLGEESSLRVSSRLDQQRSATPCVRHEHPSVGNSSARVCWISAIGRASEHNALN